jgi:cytidyltransferase-like protein
MVDGSFDPIHEGHIEYFRLAAELKNRVLCNIAPDSWTSSKHRILLPRPQRAIVLDSIRHIDFVHFSDLPTLEVLRTVRPSIYAKGADWLERGGVPLEERVLCEQMGVEVVYLDSVRNSSSRILRDYADE